MKKLHSLYQFSIQCGAALLAVLQVFAGITPPALAQENSSIVKTRTPIKHVIIIIGENRTFDHVFATYKPVRGEKVDNLLSKGIITDEGTPGPNYSLARQYSAVDTHADKYQISPTDKSSYTKLPTPLAGGPAVPFIPSLAVAKAVENGLPNDMYYKYLTTGGTGLKAGVPDTRIPNVNDLPAGPFQLTPGIPYDAYAASPVHRFYQMWQQLDCKINYSDEWNPSGCKADLFPWVETTIGAGSNGKPRPTPFTEETTKEGSTSMGFYNVQQGDAPYLKSLADRYSMSDNYHQAASGGTGMNHIEMGTGDAMWFSNGNGDSAAPPHNKLVDAGTPNAGVVDEIENPNAAPGTNNWYTEDGYGGGSYGSPSYGGGSYSNCADQSQPGVDPIVDYLRALPRPINPHCEPDHYYLLNNYNPGYFGDGTNAYTDTNANNTVFTIPPSSVRSIGDEMLAKDVSWKYYGDQWNNYLADKYQANYAAIGPNTDEYCNICNPFQYDTSIMTNTAVREAHLQDTANLYSDIASGTLPAVSFVKPSGLVDGHPA